MRKTTVIAASPVKWVFAGAVEFPLPNSGVAVETEPSQRDRPF